MFYDISTNWEFWILFIYFLSHWETVVGIHRVKKSVRIFQLAILHIKKNTNLNSPKIFMFSRNKTCAVSWKFIWGSKHFCHEFVTGSFF